MYRRILIAALLFCALQVLQAQQPVVLDEKEALGHLGKHAALIEDLTGQMGVDEALRAKGYRTTGLDVPNLGLSGSAHWVKLWVVNRSQEEHFTLHIPHADIDELDVYLVRDEQPFHLGHTGQLIPPEDRIQSDTEFGFKFTLEEDAQAMVLMRVVSYKQLQLPILIQSDNAFSRSRSKRNLLLGGFIGIMITMALYNLFVYFSMRDKSYLLYVTYIVAVALTQMAFTGIAPFYIWTEWPWFSSKATLLLTIITAVLACEFIKAFIQTKSFVPTLHLSARYFYVLFAICICLSMIDRPLEAYKLTQLISGAFAIYLLYLVFSVWKKGSRAAGYFLIAWSMFLIGTFVFVLKDMGLLPYNDLTLYLMPVGSAIEGVLLSFGLADRINILRKEKERSQADSLRISKENERIIREQNVMLEDKVKQRTSALEESNEHLKRTQTQLVNAEKMASLGQLTAGIAHEINNPINFITSNIKPLRRNISEILDVMQEYRGLDTENIAQRLAELQRKDEELGIQESIDELDDIINSIAEGSSRTAEIVRGLRNFSRLDESDLKQSDLNEGIRNTLTVLSPQYRDKVELRMDLGEIPKVECFPGKVNQVFMNILTNAAQATLARTDDQAKVVIVSTKIHEDHAIISIADNGIGMTEEVKAKIFDPFFTTKPVGEGTGLGMAIVYGIIEDHHGSIHIESTPGVGTEFRIALPIRHMQLNERRA